MEFQEVERQADFSTVQVTRRSGASVSSSMFVLRGMCAVTRARGKQYFVSPRAASEAGRYTLAFPETPAAQGRFQHQAMQVGRVLSYD